MPTFSGQVSPGARRRRLTPHECRAWLSMHHEGHWDMNQARVLRRSSLYTFAVDQILDGSLTTMTSCIRHQTLRSASTSMAHPLPIARLW